MNSSESLGEYPGMITEKQEFRVCAYYVGERIDVRGITSGKRICLRPLTLMFDTGGIAVVFRYGAVVFCDVDKSTMSQFLQELRAHIEHPYDQPESEVITVCLLTDGPERMEVGTVTLQDASVLRLQTVASVLGKTVVLSQYEADIAASFDRIEPFAAELEKRGRGGVSLRELLRHTGRTLLNEHKLLGRVEVVEKPELLWEHPELEPLYTRLEAEYELGERSSLLDRKLELISRTVRTVLEILENQRSFRVEWYIVVLIVIEIALSVYEMFWHK